MEAFSRCIAALKLPSTSPVGKYNSLSPWKLQAVRSAGFTCSNGRETVHIQFAFFLISMPMNTHTVIAVSGGCDSIALTHLARQVFTRVVGITVDHQLREESREEAEKVKEIVTGMGVEHHTLKLDWEKEGKPMSSGKVQSMARIKRYSALLGFCQQLGINVLMTGHHLNDQLGKN